MMPNSSFKVLIAASSGNSPGRIFSPIEVDRLRLLSLPSENTCFSSTSFKTPCPWLKNTFIPTPLTLRRTFFPESSILTSPDLISVSRCANVLLSPVPHSSYGIFRELRNSLSSFKFI